MTPGPSEAHETATVGKFSLKKAHSKNGTPASAGQRLRAHEARHCPADGASGLHPQPPEASDTLGSLWGASSEKWREGSGVTLGAGTHVC